MNEYLLCLLLAIMTFSSCKEENDTPPVQLPKEFDDSWFTVRETLEHTYEISEKKSSQGNISYLIAGNKRAIMFDTGSGENPPQNGVKILPLIEKLTSLPVTLLLSHFHFDHNQNIREFTDIALPELSFLKKKATSDDLYAFSEKELFRGKFPASLKVNEWLPVNEDIDLGNRVIQLVNIPGHTPESVAIIDRTNKLAFLGDFLYNGLLFVFKDEDIPVYLKSVNKLIAMLSDDYSLYGAHGSAQVSFEKLQQLKSFLECIISNECSFTTEKINSSTVHYYKFETMSLIIFQ